MSAVAELVINVSIAERSHRIYSHGHPMAVKSAAKAHGSVLRALELQEPISVHFTPEAVFCGIHCLERTHPIYRSFAERMWRFGIGGLTFARGVTDAELGSLLEVLATATREHASRARVEQLFRTHELPDIRVELLRQMVAYTLQEEVRPVTPAEQERLWEELMRRLGGAVHGSDEMVPAELSDEEYAGYAEAVVDYMKHVQRAQQQDALLRGSDLGRKISDLLQSVNPELRHQIMTSAVNAPDVTPDLLRRLTTLMGGQEVLVDSLQRLNASGQAIPPSAFRTLMMITEAGLVDGGRTAGVPTSAQDGTGASAALPPWPDLAAERREASSAQPSADAADRLDAMLGDQGGHGYGAAEYERALGDLARRTPQIARDASRNLNVRLSEHDGEAHFLLVANSLLDSESDPTVGTSLRREAESSYLFFAEAGDRKHCREAMAVARRARATAGEQTTRWAWERHEVLARLTAEVAGEDRWRSDSSADLLHDIGLPAVSSLLSMLAECERTSGRRRLLQALVAMPGSLAPALVPLIGNPAVPWFVQRNAIYVLRRRGEEGGLAAARAAWATAAPRVAAEILRYLIALQDPARVRVLEESLAHKDDEFVLAAAREALRSPEPEAVAAVIRRADQVPRHQLGNDFHLGLLRALARCGDAEARAYVAALGQRRRPLLPWQRQEFQQELDAMLAGGSG